MAQKGKLVWWTLQGTIPIERFLAADTVPISEVLITTHQDEFNKEWDWQELFGDGYGHCKLWTEVMAEAFQCQSVQKYLKEVNDDATYLS